MAQLNNIATFLCLLVFSPLVYGQTVANRPCEVLENVYVGSKVGIVNGDGGWTIEPKFDYLTGFFGDFAFASIDRLWGVIDRKGNWVIAPTYPKVPSPGNGVVFFETGGRYELVQLPTRKILGTFENAGNYSEGLAMVKTDGKYGYVDGTGRFVIPPRFQSAGPFRDEMAAVQEFGEARTAFINKRGRIVFRTPILNVAQFSEGLAVFKQGGDYGFLDKRGRIAIRPRFYEVRFGFQEGLSEARAIGKKWGFINKRGRFVIPQIYDDVEGFSEGLARVEIGGKHGFIDRKARVAIPLKYDAAGTFECGAAYVETNGRWTLINRSGRPLFQPKALER